MKTIQKIREAIMQNVQWLHRFLNQPTTLVLGVGIVEVLLGFSCYLLIWAGWHWLKRKKGEPTHMGYIRFALVLAIFFAAGAGICIASFYKADNWNWLRASFPGAIVALIIGLGGVLLINHTIIRDNLLWWLDLRIGDDEDHI